VTHCAVLVFVLALASCVTRVQVCVNADRARSYDPARPSDSVGGSVCADVERP
jgi:hypothetical protein